jgi:antitoxin MazE
MRTKVQKWGNSLAVRIPRSFAEEVQVAAGSTVTLSVERGGLMIRPVSRRTYRLSDLIERIRRENLHGEALVDPDAR